MLNLYIFYFHTIQWVQWRYVSVDFPKKLPEPSCLASRKRCGIPADSLSKLHQNSWNWLRFLIVEYATKKTIGVPHDAATNIHVSCDCFRRLCPLTLIRMMYYFLFLVPRYTFKHSSDWWTLYSWFARTFTTVYAVCNYESSVSTPVSCYLTAHFLTCHQLKLSLHRIIFFTVSRTDQPGKSAPSTVPAPDGDYPVANLNERVLSNPVVTSSTKDPEESHPNKEAPKPVLNESIVSNPSPCSRNIGVSNSRNDTFNTILLWVGKWLAGNHRSDLMYPNISYPKSLLALEIHHIEGDHLLPFSAALAIFLQTMHCSSQKVSEFWTFLRRKLTSRLSKELHMHSLFPTHPLLHPGDNNSQ